MELNRLKIVLVERKRTGKWLAETLISALFDVDRSVITKHLANIYQEGELVKEATCAIFAQVQTEGNRQVTRDIEFCNLDAIISIGYRPLPNLS
ncbi:hypothetical protein FACS189451_10860 [Bacteroidia bacterium]|nr:hypothetical protein FACS189451_10860 [Bacteroidia bacterium]